MIGDGIWKTLGTSSAKMYGKSLNYSPCLEQWLQLLPWSFTPLPFACQDLLERVMLTLKIFWGTQGDDD